MLNQRLQIAEYIFIAGSVVGWVVALVSGQLIYAAVPVSVSLLLNLINRFRIEQRMRRRLGGTIAQLHRQLLEESRSLQEQQLNEAISSLQDKLPEYLSQIESSDSEPSHLNVAQLKAQLGSLEESLSSIVQYLNSSSLPTRVERLEKAITSVTTDITQIRHQQTDARKSRLDQSERRLQANQPEDTQAPPTKAPTEPQLFTPPSITSVPVDPQIFSSPPPTD